MNKNMENPFSKEFYDSIKNELFNDILPYWEKNARDTRIGCEGFFGSIENSGKQNPLTSRSIVMTSRFLWTYSAAARFTKNKAYLEMADFAYKTIVTKFWDKNHGGVFWQVHPDGAPDVSKKQIYGEAFCCYGLSEYAAALKELREGEDFPCGHTSLCPTLSSGGSDDTPATPLSEECMNLALDIFNLLENNARDYKDGGYIEACATDWTPTTDMILSPKDMNCPKSMNTNLHVMEAYTNLYRNLPVVFPDAESVLQETCNALYELVKVTVEKILQKNAHLAMFFDMEWNSLSDEISYGHDIEASWLLWEAACELHNEELKSEIRNTVIRVADVALSEGFDHQNGCMENFLFPAGKHEVSEETKKTSSPFRDRTRVWWNQAEAMNGFYNAWEMTGERKFSDACLKQWNWILNFQIDKTGGEWWNSVDINGKPLLKEDKGGNWKTSYHNGRTCLELLRRSNMFN